MHGNASLNQGKFFVKKKRSHQYLENNTNVLLRENFSNGTLREGFQEGNVGQTAQGNEEKKNIDNWYVFPEQMIDFGGAMPEQSTGDGSPTKKSISNWRNPNSSEWNTTLEEELEQLADDLQGSSTNNDNIYAFVINNSSGNIIYYKKDATGSIPQQPVPKLKSGSFTTYLKIDNGMIEAQQRTIQLDDAINRSVKDQREQYNKLQQAYDVALNQYSKDIKLYYDKKGQAQALRVGKPNRNELIKYDMGGDNVGWGFVNTMGGIRKINVHANDHTGDGHGLNDVEFRKKIGCPTPRNELISKDAYESANYIGGTEPGLTGEGKSYGACLNPGVYQSDGTDTANKIFVDENGKVHLLTTTLSNGCKKHLNNVGTIDETLFQNIVSNVANTTTAGFECPFGITGIAEEGQQAHDRSFVANQDLKLIADCDTTDGTRPTGCILNATDETGTSLYNGIWKNDSITIHKGMKQVIGEVQSQVGGSDEGYRKLHHSLMNDDTVHLPFKDEAKGALENDFIRHFTNGIKNDSVHKDISGNVPLQRALNKKLRLADDLGSSIDSLEASLNLKNRQIKASSLQFLAWGLAGITIAIITAREFAKK